MDNNKKVRKGQSTPKIVFGIILILIGATFLEGALKAFSGGRYVLEYLILVTAIGVGSLLAGIWLVKGANPNAVWENAHPSNPDKLIKSLKR